MQQPPNQYSSNPQQQNWQSQREMPLYIPVVKPPPKHKRLWTILAVALLSILVILSAVACESGGGSQPNTTDTVSQATQPVAQPTRAAQPTAAPTHQINSASTGPAILGADIAAFIAKYGQPIPGSQPGSGDYRFSLYGNQTNDLDVVTGDSKALSILKDSPTDQGWNKSEAIASCLAFLPPDSVYKREMTLVDTTGALTDIQRVYYSPSLANRFPANIFTDENGNQATPGTFAMVLGYNLGSTSSFLSCAPQVGLQGK